MEYKNVKKCINTITVNDRVIDIQIWTKLEILTKNNELVILF